MKKMTAAVMLAGGIGALMCGCSLNSITGIPPEPQIKGGYCCDYSATAVIIPPDTGEKTEFCFGGRLRRLGMGFWEMEISSPDTLAGMKICCSDDNITASLGELSFDTAAADIPHKAPFMSVMSELDKASVSEMAPEGNSDGGFMLAAENAVICFDGSGVPVSMKITEPEISVVFSEFEASGVSDSSDGSETVTTAAVTSSPVSEVTTVTATME